MSLTGLGLLGGLTGGVTFHFLGPGVLLSDAGYAFLGTVVASLVAAGASVMVTLITIKARDRPDDGNPTPLRRRRKP